MWGPKGTNGVAGSMHEVITELYGDHDRSRTGLVPQVHELTKLKDRATWLTIGLFGNLIYLIGDTLGLIDAIKDLIA